MGILTAFVVGTAVGAVASWQLERWRQRQGATHLSGGSTPSGIGLREPQGRQHTADHGRQLLASADITLGQLPAERGPLSDDLTDVIRLDRLEHIPGMTPGFARRLNQAGILTYANLAKQTPEHLRNVVLSGEEGELPVHHWITQARALASAADYASGVLVDAECPEPRGKL